MAGVYVIQKGCWTLAASWGAVQNDFRRFLHFLGLPAECPSAESDLNWFFQEFRFYKPYNPTSCAVTRDGKSHGKEELTCLHPTSLGEIR